MDTTFGRDVAVVVTGNLEIRRETVGPGKEGFAIGVANVATCHGIAGVSDKGVGEIFIKRGGFKYTEVMDGPKKFLFEFKKKVGSGNGGSIQRWKGFVGVEGGKCFCGGRDVIEAFVAQSWVCGSSEEVDRSVNTGEVFEGGAGGGKEKIKFVKCLKGGGDGRVGSMCGRYVVHANVREVSGSEEVKFVRTLGDSEL